MANDIVKLCMDYHTGRLGSYSASDAKEAIRAELSSMIGGATRITPRMIREGACNELFALIETVVQQTSEDGLKGNEFFNSFVEYKNLALGDKNSFYVEDDNRIIVSSVAEGSQSVRRQKLEGGSEFSVTTNLKAAKVYEEMNRLIAGRADINDLIRKVSEAFIENDLNEIYAEFVKAMNSIEAPYGNLNAAGTFDEDTLLGIIEHVETANNADAVIVGSRAALRKVTTAVQADQQKDDMYNMGYYGRFNGTPMVRMRQRHAVGSTNFILPENDLYIIAGEDRFIKHITEGTTDIVTKGYWENQDLTQEYAMFQRTGNAIVMSKKAGIYRVA